KASVHAFEAVGTIVRRCEDSEPHVLLRQMSRNYNWPALFPKTMACVRPMRSSEVQSELQPRKKGSARFCFGARGVPGQPKKPNLLPRKRMCFARNGVIPQ